MLLALFLLIRPFFAVLYMQHREGEVGRIVLLLN